MSLSPAVADATAFLRNLFRNVHIASGHSLLTNARAGVQNLRYLITPTPEIDAQLTRALEHSVIIFNLLNQPFFAGRDQLDEAKAAADTAIAQLEAVLIGARPSEEAEALGLG